MSAPHILVTGGAGYIGSHTVHFLRKHQIRVTVLDNLSRGHRSNLRDVAFCQADLRSSADLDRLFSENRFDAVIHFAALIAVGESTRAPEMYYSNNVGGSICLLEAMVKAGVRRIVFSSTAAVYGNPPWTPIPETTPISPVNPYGETKVAVERLLHWMDSLRGVRHVILRYFNACGCEPGSGLGEDHDPETHLLPLALRAAGTGAPLTVFGQDYGTSDGTCVRDYIHVSDLAEAHVCALRHLLDGGHSETFNVGTGVGHTVLEVIQAAGEACGRPVPYVLGARREGDPEGLVADSTKLRAKLGWVPKYLSMTEIARTAWEFERLRQGW